MIKYCYTAILLLFSGITFAQESEIQQESSRFNFGFSLGANYSLLYNNEDTDDLTIQNAPGYRLGLLSEYELADNWTIQSKAELSFNFGRIETNNINYRVDPNNMDFMLHIKHRFNGFDGKAKPFCYFGPSLRFPLNPQSEILTLDTKPSFALDFGFGVDIQTKKFYISPEIRFTGGLTDIRNQPSGNSLRGSNAAIIISFSSK